MGRIDGLMLCGTNRRYSWPACTGGCASPKRKPPQCLPVPVSPLVPLVWPL